MLEPLAGRLKWERTADGIRVVIPARLDRPIARNLLFMAFAMVCGILAVDYSDFLISSFGAGAHSKPHLFEDVCCVCVGLFIGAVPPRIFGRTVLSLTPVRLTIDWRPRVWWPEKRQFSTDVLHNLRFASKSGGFRVTNESGQNEMQLDEDRKTRSFALGISQDEASALIAKMMEVYPFPKYLEPTTPAFRP
jgi:hypothetical protein